MLKEQLKHDSVAYVEATLFSVGGFSYINIDTVAPRYIALFICHSLKFCPLYYATYHIANF
jgi:hypothetical protein